MDVRTAQVALNLSCGARLRATGELDGLTVGALRRWQRAHRLPITGELDELTVAALRAELDRLGWAL